MSQKTTPPQAAPPDPAFGAHDLLRVAPDVSLAPSAPYWVRNALARAPWLVVRRAPVSDRTVPVGVRGSNRSERYGDHIAKTSVLECVMPEHLVKLGYGVFGLAESQRTPLAEAIDGVGRVLNPATGPNAGVAVRASGAAGAGVSPAPGTASFTTPAVRLARALAPLFRQYGLTWGPTGSVGFECASGTATTTAASDLDLIIRCEHPLPVPDAASVLNDIERLSLGFSACRVDANIETPFGTISLSEYARTSGAILMRTTTQPRLTRNPWSAAEANRA